MRFFLDENFPKAAIAMLTGRGHEVVDIRGTEHEGADDDDIFALAQAAGAIFLTTDADFFHTIPQLYETHCGVIVITLHQPNRQNILSRLAWLLDHIAAAALSQRVFRLRERTYAVYPGLSETTLHPREM